MPRVNVKGYGYVNFPADTPEEEMKSAIGKLLSGKAKIEEPQAETVPEERPGITISPEKASYVLGRKVEKPITVETPEHPFEAFGVPKETAAKVGGAAYGFIKGGTLGAAKLIPGVKEKIQKYEKEEPLATAGGEIASYFIPGGAAKGVYKGVGKAVSMIPKVGKGLVGRLLTGAGTGAATSAISESTESKGDIKETAKATATGAATGLVTTATLEGVKAGLNKLGQLSIKIALPGTKTERAKGYKATEIHKLNLDGTPNEVVKKATKEVQKTGQQITETLKAAGASARFDVEPSLAKAKNDVYKIKETAGKGKQVISAIDNIYEDLSNRGLTNKELSSEEFRKAKSIIGEIAFPKGKELLAADPAKTQAAKMIYYNMMNDMNKQIPDIKPLNLKEHKLLNVKEAVSDAIERREGQSPLKSLFYWPATAKLSQTAYKTAETAEKIKPGVITTTGRGATALLKDEEKKKKRKIDFSVY